MSQPFKVSHSKVRTWRRCRYLYHLKYVERLRRKTKGRPLMFGSFVHDALEEYHLTGSFKKTLKKYKDELSKVFEEERIELGIENLVEEGTAITKGYIKNYEDDDLVYKAVELEIEVPLVIGPNGEVLILFVGKVDGLVSEGNSDGIWVFERKSAKRIPDEGVRLSDIQTVLYWWALPHAKMKQGRKLVPIPVPRGVIWDYVRSKAPSIPKPLKSGELSKAKIDTTREVYLQAILDNDLDPDDYEDMLASLVGKEEDFFRRIKLPFSKTMADQVLDDFRSTAIEMSLLHGISKDRNLTKDCSWCEFNTLCQASLRGLDTDIMLKKDYEVRPRDEEEIQEEVRDSE